MVEKNNTTEFFTARYDAGFKNAIGCESQKDLLKAFLEKTLDLKTKKLVLDPKELEKPNIKIKTKTLDVLVQTDKKTINLEINNGYYSELPVRNLAYISSAFSNSVFSGKTYSNAKKHIQLNITWGLGDDSDKSKDAFKNQKSKTIKSSYVMYDKENDICYCDKIQIIEINMDKIMNMWYHGEKKEALEYKYFLMLDLEPEDLKKVCEGDKIMEKYKDKIIELNKNPEFIEVVSKEKDAEMVYNTLIEEEKFKIANNMLDNNIDIDTISKCTGLTPTQIEELK